MKIEVFLIIHMLLSMALAVNNDIIQAVPLPADSTLSNLIIEADGSSQGMMLFGHIVPLTSASGEGLGEAGLQNITELGLLTLWNGGANGSTSTRTLVAQEIRFLSCDDNSTDSTTPTARFLNATADNPLAILLYSTVQNTCIFLGNENRTYYQAVYTMTSMSASKSFEQTLSSVVNMSMKARLYYNATIDGSSNVNSTGQGSSPNNNNGNNGNNNNNSMAPGPSTAVAMIILYSITGLITFLFLAVIGIGAIRAHRHPDRYGPRAAGAVGGPRQSRAKGIARAVLEGLPIVRFNGGNRDDTETATGSKPDDLEMNGGGTESRTTIGEREAENHAPREDITPVAHISEGARGHEGDQSATASVRGSVANSGRNSLMNPLQRDCPICLNDFEAGQDLRVLPCHHSFHPECVDPWLLNVAGSCPLCRIDLHPDENAANVQESETVTTHPNTPEPAVPIPPIRFSRYIDVIRLTSSSSPERVNALRQLREDLLSRQRQRRASRSSMSSHVRTSSFGGAFSSAHRRASSAVEPIDIPVEGEVVDTNNGSNSGRWRRFSARRRTLDGIISPVASAAEVNESAPIETAPAIHNNSATIPEISPVQRSDSDTLSTHDHSLSGTRPLPAERQ